jgi:hypothetical protein
MQALRALRRLAEEQSNRDALASAVTHICRQVRCV